MKILQRSFVALKAADFYRDEYGVTFVSLDFCRKAAQLADQEPTQDADADELSGSGKSEPEPEPQPAGLEFLFDDESRTVTYGGATLTLRGAIQYQILKLAEDKKTVNNRLVWRAIWGDSQVEWRAIRNNAGAVNAKLEAAGIPYRLDVKSDFLTFCEKF